MKTKIKVNRNYILSHPFIKITKDYKYKLEANNGVNRSSWSVKEQLYIINNMMKKVRFTGMFYML